MGFVFKQEDVDKISSILGGISEQLGECTVWNIKGYEAGKPMIVTLYSSVDLGKEEEGALLSVQTGYGYYELHGVNSYMPFEPDEVIFVAKNEDKVSCLVLGNAGTCSLYSNINLELLEADFAELDPATLLAATQLSIVQNIIE